MNDVKFMDQVDETLQHEFSAAALASGRPAAQIVSELMRAYLSQTQEYVGDKPQPVAISTAERQRRYEASESATANVALEGFTQTKEAQAHAQRFIDGEIDLEGYLAPTYEDIHGRDELAKSKDRQKLESFHTARRCFELQLDPVRGNFRR